MPRPAPAAGRPGKPAGSYVALLRAVNVGGRARVPMAGLRAIFEELGCSSVSTYIQSGNVVFRPPGPPAPLIVGVERALEELAGVSVRVLWRSASDLAEVARRNPLIGGGRDPARLAVTFLEGAAPPEAIDRLDADRLAPDEVRIDGAHVYLHCPGGFGRAKLGNELIERRLGMVATTRNWNTVTTLARLSAEAASAPPG